MLNIYYGRENLDKDKFIFDNLGKRALILVPDQFTLEMERELFMTLKSEALMDIEVLSTTRLGFRLLSELGGSKRTFIDKYGRHMLLSEVARQSKDELNIFRGLEEKNSFIESVNNFISEMKQNNCGENELKLMAEKLDSIGELSYSKKKLEDLYLLFTKYEEKIQGKYTDSEDKIDLYAEKIKDSQLIKGNTIWIYGFDSFAPKFLNIVGELMNYAENVNVVLTWSENSKDRDVELFAISELVINNLKRSAESRGVKWDVKRIPQTYQVSEKVEELKHLEHELYALPGRTWKAEAPALTLISAANLYNEAEDAAAYVLKLVREEGMKFSDIRVISNDNDVLGPILKRTFREYGMDLFSDSVRDILQSPVPQYLLALLEVKTSSYSQASLMNWLKSGFSELSYDEIADLENYAIKYKIRGNMWKKPFIKGEKEYGVEGLHRLNQLREKTMEPLMAFEENYKVNTNREFIEKLYQFIYKENGLKTKALEFISVEEEDGNIENAEETEQIWKEVISILGQINEIAGEDEFKPSAFKEVLKTGISEVEIGVLPPTKDGLIMGNMQRTRTGNLKALVVVGANEGILPKEKSSGGLFNNDEKELFKDSGIELCQVDSVMLLEEKMAIYRNLSRPIEKLYISYSASDIDGRVTKPSSVFTRISEIFPKVPVEKDILNREDRRDLINSGTSGLRHLTEEVLKVAEKGVLPTEWKETATWFRNNREESINSVKDGITFDNKVEKLGKAAADALYRRDPEAALSLSPSRLERYSRCPFSHLVSYGLKPEERRIYETAAREIGDVYHDCIMTFTRELTKNDQGMTSPDSLWMTITEDETKKRVKEIVNAQTEAYREGLFKTGNEEKYREKRIVDICAKACWALISQVRAGKIIDGKFEAEFGRGKSIKPIEVKVNGETAYIEGKIDRVDYLPDNRVKIIDYKTGNEDFKTEEAKQGYRLQLLLYLKAAEEENKKPAGVFYFHISEPSEHIEKGKPDYEKLARDIQKSFKMKGLIVNDEEVIKNVAGEFEKQSIIIPISNSKTSGIGGSEDTLLSEEKFLELENTVSDKIANIVSDLAEGGISINPMKSRKNGESGKNACRYCQYKGICMFDTAFSGNSWNLI